MQSYNSVKIHLLPEEYHTGDLSQNELLLPGTCPFWYFNCDKHGTIYELLVDDPEMNADIEEQVDGFLFKYYVEDKEREDIVLRFRDKESSVLFKLRWL